MAIAESSLPGQDRQAILEFQLQTGQLRRAVSGASARGRKCWISSPRSKKR